MAVVVPSCAVITVLMVFCPTNKWTGGEAAPDNVVAPFTCTIAVESAVVGVTVIELMLLGTEAV